MKVVAFRRELQGTGASRRLRNSGQTPGIIYGGTEAPVTISLDHNALFHALKKEAFHSSILDLEIDGQAQKVLLRDFQMHAYKQLVLHADFQRVDPNQPIHVKVGDRVRFWVVNCGPTHPCAYHVVGEQFDTMYLGAPPGTPIRGVQTWDVPAGGGMCFELVCDIPGEFPFVNHGFGHAQKGAIGFLVVEA